MPLFTIILQSKELSRVVSAATFCYMAATQKSSDEMAQLKVSLEELDAIVNTLIQHHDLERAVQFALRGLDIRRQCFGLGSEEMETARIRAAQLIVTAARAEQANDKPKETAELLAHVDSLTEHVLPLNLTSLDRARRVTRLQMMKELMIARYRQGRHRSALTFGKHVLELARDTMCFYELPALHLNVASVHSALGQHRDALRHCYIAFQKLCLILEAVDDPESHSFVAAALLLEPLDIIGDSLETRYPAAFDIFIQCSSLVAGELSEEVDMSAVPPNFRSPSAFGDAEEMLPERRRWGGVLALAFRSLAAEQEHLYQLDGALLTYKVAHTTALACLGAEHPVSLQCEQALRDAEQAAKGRMSRAPKPSGPNTSTNGAQGGSLLSMHSMSSSKRSASSQSSRGKKVAESAGVPAAGTGPRAATFLKRPAWNDWFTSDGPVPSHVEEKHRAECRERSGRPALGTTAASSLNVSAIDVSEHFPERARSSMSNSRGWTGGPRNSTPLPPRPATTSFGDMPSRSQHAGGPAAHSLVDAQRANTFEPLSLADFSFLQNTFKLRYDINFNRPQHRYGTSNAGRNMGKRDAKELKALAEERRAAEELAAEIGFRD